MLEKKKWTRRIGALNGNNQKWRLAQSRKYFQHVQGRKRQMCLRSSITGIKANGLDPLHLLAILA